jgi:hypothetical protein
MVYHQLMRWPFTSLNNIQVAKVGEDFLLQNLWNVRRGVGTLVSAGSSVPSCFPSTLSAIILFSLDFYARAIFSPALQSLNSTTTGKLFACDVFVFMRPAMPFFILQNFQDFGLQASLFWRAHRGFLFAFASKPCSNSAVVMPKPLATLTMAVSDGLRTPRSSPEM